MDLFVLPTQHPTHSLEIHTHYIWNHTAGAPNFTRYYPTTLPGGCNGLHPISSDESVCVLSLEHVRLSDLHPPLVGVKCCLTVV